MSEQLTTELKQLVSSAEQRISLMNKELFSAFSFAIGSNVMKKIGKLDDTEQLVREHRKASFEKVLKECNGNHLDAYKRFLGSD